MSYCYDVMSRVFNGHVRRLLEENGKEKLAYRFERLIEDMHNANHEVPSANGVFKGDGINKDARVTKAAQNLDMAATEAEKASREATSKGGGA